MTYIFRVEVSKKTYNLNFEKASLLISARMAVCVHQASCLITGCSDSVFTTKLIDIRDTLIKLTLFSLIKINNY